MTNTHLLSALDHLEAAKHFRYRLEDEYERVKPDKALVADMHERIRFAQKQAEVLMLAAIASSLNRIDSAISEWDWLEETATPPHLQIFAGGRADEPIDLYPTEKDPT